MCIANNWMDPLFLFGQVFEPERAMSLAVSTGLKSTIAQPNHYSFKRSPLDLQKHLLLFIWNTALLQTFKLELPKLLLS